jgi:translocation protein SEC63
MLRHFVTKKRNICDIKEFVKMKDADRRSILRNLTNDQYEDIMRVCARYPLIEMHVNPKIFDDEDEQVITAGAIVTVGVILKRQNFSVLFEKDDGVNEDETGGGDEVEIEEIGAVETSKPSQAKKGNGNQKGGKSGGGQKKAAVAVKKPVEKVVVKDESNSDDGELVEGEEGEDDGEGNSSNNVNKSSSASSDDYFEKFQQIQKKKESLETKEKISHRVYCPYFPEVSLF